MLPHLRLTLKVIDEPLDPLSPFARLAELTMMQADGPGLMLNRARHELLLAAAGDPGIAETSQAFAARVFAMANDAIAHLQPGTDDPALLAAQTTAVTTFIAGVFTRFVGGDRTINNAGQLAGLLEAVATAISMQRADADS